MFQQLDSILPLFRPCFSRDAAFRWCVIIVVGLYIRIDHDGLTSIIRWLSLSPSCYDGLLHFFYANSWSLDTLLLAWANWLMTAENVGYPCYAALDAYFAVGPTFLLLKEQLTDAGTQMVHLITCAKKNTVAYFVPEAGIKRFRQKERLKLKTVFDMPSCFPFITAQVTMYGKKTTMSYCCLNLLWKPIDGMLRCVLIQHGGQRVILMSSDLTRDPLSILHMYAFRTKIEVMFDVFKNVLGGLAYHFWAHLQPKLSRKKGWTVDWASLTDVARQQVVATLTATERFVNIALIAVGILQYLSLTVPTRIWQGYSGWLRTYSSQFPSERVVKMVIANEFFDRRKVRWSRTFQTILSKKRRASGVHPPVQKK